MRAQRLRLILQTILKAKEGAVFHFGVVRSSWVAICRATSGRSYLSPLGFTDREFVVSGNIMMARRGSGVLLKVHALT